MAASTSSVDPEENAALTAFRASNGEHTHLSLLTPAECEADTAPHLLDQPLSLASLILRSRRADLGLLAGRSFTQIIFFGLICMIVLIASIDMIVLKKRLIAPLTVLSRAFHTISQGDLAYRIQGKSSMKEITAFYAGFNGMLDSIQMARDESVTHQMDSAHARLQYLQLQIRPHFYLNCLKNIHSLAIMHEDQKIQDLVILLSDYLRYSFQSAKNFISLREELEAVQSYVDLCQALEFPVKLEFDLESDVLTGQCLPYAILTFLENSIKHTRTSNTLIRIAARRVVSEDGSSSVVISIEDTGNGFSEEALRYLNAADPTRMIYRKDRVGIANIRYRLWLIYREKASVIFENRGSNAAVRVTFPFEPFLGKSAATP